MPYEEEILPSAAGPEPSPELNELSRGVIGAAIEVHRQLGPGLPEEAYQRAMQMELTARGIAYVPQMLLEVHYQGQRDSQIRIDLLVGKTLVVELKSVDTLASLHFYQCKTYMRLVGQPLGLLINFNVPVLKDGIRRVVQSF